jgi:hypothetical protein
MCGTARSTTVRGMNSSSIQQATARAITRDRVQPARKRRFF